MPRPICTDCQWVRKPGDYAECHAPQGRPVGDYLSGSTSTRAHIGYCSIQREAGWWWARQLNNCGKEGRWFVPKDGDDA